MRPLYKRVFNPRVIRAAAVGKTRCGVIHHIGRHSGIAYDTPIDAERTPDGVLIPVVYGPRADWCRNVLAAGQCTLTLGAEELQLSAPQVIPIVLAEPQLSPDKALFWRSIGIEHCLSLQRLQEGL